MRVRNQRPGRPAPTGGATGHSGTGMGIYNRKQESKKKKHALDQESDQENDQEKEKAFLFFLFSLINSET